MTLVPKTAAFPWPTLPLDLDKFQAYYKVCVVHKIGYLWDGKAHNRLAFPPDYQGVDCSGFSAAIIAYSTGGAVQIPDGSVMQHSWFAHSGLKVSSEEALPLADGRLRICFIEPKGDEAGHVFFCRNGKTSESFGGHGVGSRAYDAMTGTGQTLQQRVDAVYVLTA